METILVVDDDAQVLAIVGKMLEGYRILNALNAEESVRRAVASWRSSSAFSGPR